MTDATERAERVRVRDSLGAAIRGARVSRIRAANLERWGKAVQDLEAEHKKQAERIERQRAALKLAMGYLATHGPRDERDAGAHFAAVSTVEAALAAAEEP